MTAKISPADRSTVKVVPPFQVVHEGTVYGPGETAKVPVDVAAFWTANGWATE